MYCAIDFGTSNSAVCIPDGAEAMRLVELEPGYATMPTAVFYAAEGRAAQTPLREFGRAALAAYVDGIDGRLMRSMKSILGSTLIDQTTDVGGGRAVRYLDVVSGYLAHLRACAEAAAGRSIRRVVLGRPVYFVDDDPARDAAAQRALESAARQAGFTDVEFQFEPIAAAFDYERTVSLEQIVLVADIGGGTADFSVVRVGPSRAAKLDRKADILANHGVHVAGTDFDRRIELACILPECGYGALGPASGAAQAREVPSAIYFDLATWHLINTVYNPLRIAELRQMRGFYADPTHHVRLLQVVGQRLGHELLARAEGAKITVADGGDARIDLGHIEAGLAVTLREASARRALGDDVERIVAAARLAIAQAGLDADAVAALYFTGGSTGLRLLTDRLAAAFPAAQVVRGDRFASVANGLGLYARRRHGARARSS